MSLRLYLHLPFCRSKCHYCDFNSRPAPAECYPPYLDALAAEMTARATGAGPLETIYIGGGTPTALSTEQLVGLLAATRERFDASRVSEVSVEANPGTVEIEKLRALRAAGVNRVSLGVQSFREDELRRLGRTHTVADAETAIAATREAGFDNLSLDLIFGLPLQTLADWRESLERAISHSPEHLSAYALSVGEGTPLAGRIARGELPAPDEDTQAEMFLETGERLRAAGYARYEISNFGRPGFACRHNLGYWSGADYLGLGAGAHSYVGGVRWANCDDPERYVARMSAGALPVESAERLGRSDRKLERLALALRTTEGLALDRYADEFGPDAVAELRTQELEAAGLVVRRNGALTLTEQGRPVANEVLLRLMS